MERKQKATLNDLILRVFMAGLMVAMTAIAYWMNNISQGQRELITLVEKVEKLEDEMAAVELWQENWPRTGLLQADVEQNANIKFLRTELERTNRSLQSLQDDVLQIRINQSSGGKDPRDLNR